MTVPALVVFVALLAALAAFQVALIAGAPIGRLAWGGQHDVLPGRLRVGSAVSVVLYALFALAAAERVQLVGLLPGDDPVTRVVMWVLFGYFALGIALNAISRSRPERFTMTPVAALLALAALVLALS